MKTIKTTVVGHNPEVICDGCLKKIRTEHMIIHQRLNRADVPHSVFITCNKPDCIKEVPKWGAK